MNLAPPLQFWSSFEPLHLTPDLAVKYNDVARVRVQPAFHSLTHGAYLIQGRGMSIRPTELLDLPGSDQIVVTWWWQVFETDMKADALSGKKGHMNSASFRPSWTEVRFRVWNLITYWSEKLPLLSVSRKSSKALELNKGFDRYKYNICHFQGLFSYLVIGFIPQNTWGLCVGFTHQISVRFDSLPALEWI